MPSALRPGSEVILTVEKAVVGGRMLARHEGQVVFVAAAVPGERVRARVERVSRQLAFAETVDVLDPSPDRRSQYVDWGCGGSLYAHIRYERQLALKADLVAESFTRIGRMTLPGTVPVMGSGELGYRMRARLHAQDGRFGFFREGTHELCEVETTRQLLPETVAAIRCLEEALKAAGIAGVISCEIAENVPASERAVLLELDPSQRAPLHFEPVEGVTGLLFADHERLTIGYGSPYVADRLDLSGAPVALLHHVRSFFQGNRFLLSHLATRVIAQVPPGAVTELYAGVGLFAVSLAARGSCDVVAVEGDRSSVRDLESNAAPYSGAIRVEHTPVEDYLARRSTQTPGTLVVDPPRTGLSPEAISGILGLKPARIVYVSCDPATVARDARRFVEAGYSLEHIESFDLFPNTAHVETLVVMVRKP